MNPGDLLHLIVEASLALAGFAGVVTVLTRRGAAALPVFHRLSLVNLLATALGALFLSLVALVLLSAGIMESIVWRAISGAGLLVSLYFASASTRTILSNSGEGDRRRNTMILLAINGPLLLVCGVQLWNIATQGEFWPVLLLLVTLFAIGCFSFVRLLFGAS